MQNAKHIFYHYTESSCAELILAEHIAREYPWHAHTHHWIIGMVCSGTAYFSTRESRQALRRGESFIVPPNVAHSLKVYENTTLAVLCINPNKNIEENVIDFLSSLQNSDYSNTFLNTVSIHELEKLKDMAIRLSEQPDFESHELLLSPPILVVVKKLQDYPEEIFSLDEMAAVAGYSRWHFLRLFQKEVGLTPHAYQMVCRLRLLRVLLRTDTAAADAAVSAGFSDQSHMHKVFKLHHGLTPRQFRQASTRGCF